jgi:hypothetical protein
MLWTYCREVVGFVFNVEVDLAKREPLVVVYGLAYIPSLRVGQ